MNKHDSIRKNFPELLRQKDVFAICLEFGMSVYSARLLIEGKKAPLKRHNLIGKRGHYKREQLLTLLS